MCVEQSRNPSVDERMAIWRRIPELQPKSPTRSVIHELEELVRQLNETHHNDKYRVLMAEVLENIADRYVKLSEDKQTILAFRKALTHCTSTSPVGLFRINWCARIMGLARQSGNDEYIIPAKKTMLDLVRVYAGAGADVFGEVWVPALLVHEDDNMMDLIIPCFDAETDADLREKSDSNTWLQPRLVYPLRPKFFLR
jgi:hypothetical protein